jgi:hypothetical protein
MPQTSALRREELAPAPTHITINANDVPNPKNAEIANDGSVIFGAAKGCWLYFSPTDVFGDHLELNPGPNGPFYQRRQSRSRRIPRHAWTRNLSSSMRPRTSSYSPHQIAHLTGQWMRLLHRHALERPARHRRNRAAPLRTRFLARVALTDRERAALAWTEAVTRITDGHVPDAVYEELRPHFREKELADLTLAIATINAWNRLAIASRTEPGKYQPAKVREVKKTA